LGHVWWRCWWCLGGCGRKYFDKKHAKEKASKAKKAAQTATAQADRKSKHHNADIERAIGQLGSATTDALSEAKGLVKPKKEAKGASLEAMQAPKEENPPDESPADFPTGDQASPKKEIRHGRHKGERKLKAAVTRTLV
jgi:hypothetical protein